MTKGLVLLFNRKESEHGYPYINIYNLIEVEFDKEEWDEDPYIVLSRSHKEIAIGSWEESNNYRSRVETKLDNLKGKYLHVDDDGLFEIYDADEKKTIQIIENQEKITHNLGEFLASLFLHLP